jgi:aminoglycoside 3-N-acetyltransferase
MNKKILTRFLPEAVVQFVRQNQRQKKKNRITALPALSEEMLLEILANKLEIKSGDTVFIHSSINNLNLDFPFYRVIRLLQDSIGKEGTILFPTYTKPLSYEFLLKGEIFDVRKSPSYTGILSEFARKQKNARRSLHPTKSVCAIGKHAEDLVSTHQYSPYPYDSCSPYYKIMKYNGKIIGLGVATNILSFVHCIDDYMKDDFVIDPYHEQLFHATVINYDGRKEIVKTFAHNMKMMNHNIPRYIKTYIPRDVCSDLRVYGMEFYRANSCELFNQMLELAKKSITIYPRKSYKKVKTS